MGRIIKFLKDWTLVVSIVSGAAAYVIWHFLPAEVHVAGPALLAVCKKLQPMFLFMMLFLSFCKIEPSQMRPRKWMAWMLLLQGGLFVLMALVLSFFPQIPFAVGLESAMLCIICPTATACAVVTGKLGGDMAGVVTYTVLINLLVSIVVPLMVPMVHPMDGLTFISAFLKILAKVFPLLIMPCLVAWLVRYTMPKFHQWLLRYTNLSFYIWAVSLSLAILMSTRAIMGSGESAWVLGEIALASLIACVFQFWAGRRIGSHYKTGEKNLTITVGQAFGQKNTVFAIWMGYTFLDPIVSVAGGFYSIWHNVYNTIQLRKAGKS